MVQIFYFSKLACVYIIGHNMQNIQYITYGTHYFPVYFFTHILVTHSTAANHLKASMLKPHMAVGQ